MVGLSFHICEKLHLCIHCIGKEGYVLLEKCQQSCSYDKDLSRKTFSRAADLGRPGGSGYWLGGGGSLENIC